jgi:hypothetical protein
MNVSTRFRIGIVAALSLAALSAHAQPTMSFTAANEVGNGSVVPSFSWATTPEATRCEGTGPANWAGIKAGSGSQTLPAITETTTYGLVCEFATNTMKLSWVNPTQNVDGSALTNLASVLFKLRSSAGALDAATPCTGPGAVRCETVTPPLSPKTFGGFANGTWRAVGFAVTSTGAQSAPSGEVSKVISSQIATDQRSITITVNPIPNPITGLTAE